jgi:tight adherence protein C
MILIAAWGIVAGSWCWFGTTNQRDLPLHASLQPDQQSTRTRPPQRRHDKNNPTSSSAGDLVRHGHRCLAVVVAGGLLAVTLHPVVGLLPLFGLWAWPRFEQRRRKRRETAAVVDQLPDVVDLLRLTTLAGFPVSAALLAIDDRPGGIVGAALHEAARRLSGGATTSDALATLARHCSPGDGDQTAAGDPIRPLVEALTDHDRYGTPLGPALDRVGIESRLHRRRQAEEAARRLPVTLLFPLVFTTLPACGLLTVIPLLVASLSSLQP